MSWLRHEAVAGHESVALWLATLSHAGFEVIHWSAVGAAGAPDYEIMLFAQEQDYTICTLDLDFGLMLAASGNGRPSVVQIRSQDVLPQWDRDAGGGGAAADVG